MATDVSALAWDKVVSQDNDSNKLAEGCVVSIIYGLQLHDDDGLPWQTLGRVCQTSASIL